MSANIPYSIYNSTFQHISGERGGGQIDEPTISWHNSNKKKREKQWVDKVRFTPIECVNITSGVGHC